MYRKGLEKLRSWRNHKKRKPLVFRGARQVGKTFLVAEFSKEFKQFVKIDFIESPQLLDLFQKRSSLSSKEVVKNIELALKIKIDKQNC